MVTDLDTAELNRVQQLTGSAGSRDIPGNRGASTRKHLRKDTNLTSASQLIVHNEVEDIAKTELRQSFTAAKLNTAAMNRESKITETKSIVEEKKGSEISKSHPPTLRKVAYTDPFATLVKTVGEGSEANPTLVGSSASSKDEGEFRCTSSTSNAHG